MKKKSKKHMSQEDKDCQSKQYYGSMCADKKCQATKYYKRIDKNCQTSDTWPKMPEMNKQLPKPAFRRLCSDKNCQSTRYYKKTN